MVTEAPAAGGQAVSAFLITGEDGEQIQRGTATISGVDARVEFATKSGMMCAECIGCPTCPIYKLRNKDSTILNVTEAQADASVVPKPTTTEGATRLAETPLPMPKLWETAPQPKKDVVGWPDDTPPPAVKDLIPEVKPVMQTIVEEHPREEAEVKQLVESSNEEQSDDSSIIRTIEPQEKTVEEVGTQSRVLEEVPEQVQTPTPDVKVASHTGSVKQTIEVSEEGEESEVKEQPLSEGEQEEEPEVRTQQIIKANEMEVEAGEVQKEDLTTRPVEPPQMSEDLTTRVVMPEKAEEPAPQIETPKALLDEIVRIAQGPPPEFASPGGAPQEVRGENQKDDDVIILKSSDRMVKIDRKKLLRILPALHPNLRRSVEFKKLVSEIAKIEEKEERPTEDKDENTAGAPEELLWQNTGQQQTVATLTKPDEAWLFYFWLLLREYYGRKYLIAYMRRANPATTTNATPN
jgi:hypothetical protein